MELYNKYRPKTFDEILGNPEAINSVKAELDHGSHVFLFTGEGGCGKTTLARCIADYLNITAIHEINSSDNRGIDTAREIGEEIRYAALDGGKSLYILDEFHLTTSAAQNAFLKILEDCPEHVIFCIVTTNPEKLIGPLKTRCSIVNLKPLNAEVMFGLLRKVAHKEGIQISPDILKRIAGLSDGSSRKALKILSSVLYLESDDERLAFLNKNSFDETNPDVLEFCRAMIKREGMDKYLECLEKLDSQIKAEPESIRFNVMGYAKSCIKRSKSVVGMAMLQAFYEADTYRNKDYAIWMAVLNFNDYCSQIQ